VALVWNPDTGVIDYRIQWREAPDNQTFDNAFKALPVRDRKAEQRLIQNASLKSSRRPEAPLAALARIGRAGGFVLRKGLALVLVGSCIRAKADRASLASNRTVQTGSKRRGASLESGSAQPRGSFRPLQRCRRRWNGT
jgi:hypothetical protein